MRVLERVTQVFPVILIVQAIGGVGAIIVGAVTLNWSLAIGGLGQLLLAGLVIATNPGSSETVVSTAGSSGEFVIRASRSRRWRIERGSTRVRALLRDERIWTVKVRRRQDDPIGATTMHLVVPTEAEARALQQRLSAGVREGRTFSQIASDPVGTARVVSGS